MSGTRSGGRKAAKTNISRHGKNFYRTIGKSGGAKSSGGGFTGDPERAQLIAALGGLKRRGIPTDYMERKQAILDQIKELDDRRRAEGMV